MIARANGHATNGTPARSKPTRITRQAKATGQISADRAYTAKAFARELGAGRWALKEMRRAGLIVRKFGGRSYILGADFIRFLETCGDGAGD
jgi:hypothetical protein